MAKTVLYGVGSIDIDQWQGVVTLSQRHEGERNVHYVEIPSCAVESIIDALRQADAQSKNTKPKG